MSTGPHDTAAPGGPSAGGGSDAKETAKQEAGKVADVVVIDGAYDDWTGLGERVREVWMAGERVSTGGRLMEEGVTEA